MQPARRPHHKQIGKFLRDPEAREHRRRTRFAFFSWRDGGPNCFACGEPVDFTRRDPNDPMRMSLDHIIPRSRGGSDELGNLRLAHAKCNSERGNRLDEEEEDL